MNKLKYIIIIFAVVLCSGACSDNFLEEVSYKKDVPYLGTAQGLKEMAAGLPVALRIQFSGEFGVALNNLGTDEYSMGSDPAGTPWNNYDALLGSTVRGIPNAVDPSTPWNFSYAFFQNINTVIASAPESLAGDPELNDILGSALFMRAWLHFYLLQQWGNIPMLLEPVKKLTNEFAMTPKPVVLQQVIDDFTEAYSLLTNPGTRVQGKIYKDAAAHYLAKALLYRQSEINNDFNAATKTEDLSKALALCDEVIAHRPLAPNFVQLTDFTGDACPAEKLDEIILSAQFTDPSKKIAGRHGNPMAFLCVSVYQNWSGMQRDVAGGREYSRLRPTEYALNVYDRVNDSRFWKSYRTTQRLNKSDTRRGKWASALSKVKQANGQLGIMFIINNADDADRFQTDTLMSASGPIYHYPGSTAGRTPLPVFMDTGGGVWDSIRCPETGNIVPNVIPRYRRVRGMPDEPAYGYATVETGNVTPGTDCIYPSCSKFLDGTRSNITSADGARDFITARVSETILMAAEIKVRQGDFPGAIEYVNLVRKRAGYKAGEDREAYVDGGQAFKGTTPPSSFYNRNTYYISNNIPVTTDATDITISSYSSLPPEDEAIIAKLGYTSDFDRMMCLILNERTRELCAELIRWTDLARTKTLIDRTLAYNPDAIFEKSKGPNNGLREHHYLRPIPQTFLDQIYKDGRPLTAEEKKAIQNPGY